MFKQDKIYYLLDVDKYKFQENESSKTTKLDEILDDFDDMYPKRFKKLKKLIVK